MFRRVSDSASKGVLDVLKSIYLSFRKVIVQRVTVVEFGMYNRGGDEDFSSFSTVYLTNI